MRFAASWIIAVFFALPAMAQAQTDPLTAQKRADIRQLIGVTGTTKISGQFAEVTARSLAGALKRQHPDLPERVSSQLRTELIALFEERANAQGGLIDRIVGIYHRQFTHSEVKELLAFNETPIGRKTLQVLPSIMSESMVAGQEWGSSLAPEVQKRVKAVLAKEGLSTQPEK